MTLYHIIILTINVFGLMYLKHAHEYMHKLKKENEFLKSKNERLEKNIKEIMTRKFNLKNDEK